MFEEISIIVFPKIIQKLNLKGFSATTTKNFLHSKNYES